MRFTFGFCTIVLGAALVAAPANAQALNLGGLTSSLTSGLSNATGGLTGGLTGAGGGTGGGTSVGVPGVATANVGSSGGLSVNGAALGGGGSTAHVDLSGITGDDSSVNVTLPGTGGLLGSSDPTGNLVGSINDTVNGLTGDGGTVDSILGNGLGGLGGLGGILGGGGGSNGGPGGGGPGRVVFANTGGGVSVGPFGSSLACVGPDSRQVLNFAVTQRFGSRSVRAWQHASSIRLIPLKLCPSAKRAVARVLRRDPDIRAMQSAAARDPLISTSLGRSRFGADDVLAVQPQGSMLSVFVF